MFVRDERLLGMRGMLCEEFLDFAGRSSSDLRGAIGAERCERATCPGPGHLWTWADLMSPRTGVPAPDLLRLFGAALFGRLVRSYPAFFVGIESTVDLLGRYEAHVVAEVRKLDGRAQPPDLTLVRQEGPVEVIYRSAEGLAELAEGLLRGSVAHFGEPFRVERIGSKERTLALFRLAEKTLAARLDSAGPTRARPASG
jgi:hypothetical protein